MVVIVDSNEVSELEVTSLRSSLRGNTFHRTSITKECIRMVVNQVIAWLVEYSRSVSLSNGKTNSIGKPLTKRSSCNFYAGSVMLQII